MPESLDAQEVLDPGAVADGWDALADQWRSPRFCGRDGFSRGRGYVIKGGFDTAYRRLGPGRLLTHAALRRAFEQGLHSYELLGAAEPYKLVWTSEGT